MRVEVAYCLPDRQIVLELDTHAQCTAGQAIEQSGIVKQLKPADQALSHIGIFGKKCKLETQLTAHDRVEIYRTLVLSPTDARKLRAKTLRDKQTQ